MSGWAGFSDAELRKLQEPRPDPVLSSSLGVRKAGPGTRSRQQIQRDQALLRSQARSESRSQSRSESRALSEEQRLSKPEPRPESRPQPDVQTRPQSGPQTRTGAEATAGPGPGPGPGSRPGPGPGPGSRPGPGPGSRPGAGPGPEEGEERKMAAPGAELKELEKQEVEIRERSRLEQLQIQQKEMEEQNKKKKDLLTKTIQEKSKQTRAEALKLQRIQKELQTLDELVSQDVSILRDRIEQVCNEYSTARKRYEKAEAEFVAAKLELHKKTELKEQLTEHLCTIIQQNESRKSLKLEELMGQLHLSDLQNQTEENLQNQTEENLQNQTEENLQNHNEDNLQDQSQPNQENQNQTKENQSQENQKSQSQKNQAEENQGHLRLHSEDNKKKTTEDKTLQRTTAPVTEEKRSHINAAGGEQGTSENLREHLVGAEPRREQENGEQKTDSAEKTDLEPERSS